MPRGQEFSKEFKQLAFSIIEFVEKEKSGPSIPLNNVNGRLQALLGISERSVYYLKSELKALVKEQEDSTRLRRSSSASSPSVLPSPSSPKKQNAGRPKIQLTTLEQDTIRLTFHLLLKDKIYPTLENLLSALLAQEPDFPIRSRMSLHRQLKLIGFKYRQTKKANVLMDATAFQAQRAVYFRKLEELRSSKAVLYYHDETWMNRNEEKTVSGLMMKDLVAFEIVKEKDSGWQ
ncbi:unnamed protein product [Didymodactylos carnosus]|uniref:Uncharacterized protein n=3 Tax=Didymodactylos carnosus TaxID=1234261 RepID=A0A8S2X1X6_9BILA|nr:unnamed protein product [Didymodactylos carnosus]